jgi:hypothetical protein
MIEAFKIYGWREIKRKLNLRLKDHITGSRNVV